MRVVFAATIVLLCGMLSSCESYRETMHGFGHSLGAIMTTDLHHAWAWEDVLHKNSGYTKSQVEVVEGPGKTRIIIHNVRPGESPEAMAQNIREMARQKPEIFGPTEVSIARR
jgi:hypothetical protein